MTLLSELTIHHIGCLTENIENSLAIYKKMGFGKASNIYDVKAQNVKVCFVEIGANMLLELVEFTAANNPALKNIFDTRNPYYHVGYLVKDLPSVVQHLRDEGFYLVNEGFSEAYKGKRFAFLYSPELHLIELIEA